mmetsp:Transcript_20732/g.59193  ORF Transcript_20732/g.59193 Transcript_20732/m.59193 type:complete len:254 (+) Transcript_20732:277-1038(+)
MVVAVALTVVPLARAVPPKTRTRRWCRSTVRSRTLSPRTEGWRGRPPKGRRRRARACQAASSVAITAPPRRRRCRRRTSARLRAPASGPRLGTPRPRPCRRRTSAPATSARRAARAPGQCPVRPARSPRGSTRRSRRRPSPPRPRGRCPSAPAPWPRHTAPRRSDDGAVDSRSIRSRRSAAHRGALEVGRQERNSASRAAHDDGPRAGGAPKPPSWPCNASAPAGGCVLSPFPRLAVLGVASPAREGCVHVLG